MDVLVSCIVSVDIYILEWMDVLVSWIVSLDIYILEWMDVLVSWIVSLDIYILEMDGHSSFLDCFIRHLYP